MEQERVWSREEIQKAFEEQRKLYAAQPFPPYGERRGWLAELKTHILKNENACYEALSADFGYRTTFDSFFAEYMPLIEHLKYSIKKLKRWMKPSKRSSGLALMPSAVRVHYQPLGVVGVIVPWNFPIYLSLGPVITALAAGNRVMVKLSEFTPHTNAVIRQILEPLADRVIVIEGEAETAAAFSQLAFDHLLFTGSTRVGRLVAKAAAENLTPVTLELGGKSPAIIAPDAKLGIAVDNILLGKSINSGQICVAPDYVLLPKGTENAFVEAYKERFSSHFSKGNQLCDYSHIINELQFKRLNGYLEDAVAKGANCVEILPENTNMDEAGRGHVYPPRIITNASDDMDLMQNEIFGPILPLVPYDSLEDAVQFINQRPRPLALYIMTTKGATADYIIKQTHSGGVCVNDTIMHVAADDAPFGGIGESGMGHYHGFEGFKTFSKAKTVLYSKAWLPRSRYLLKYRHSMFKLFRKVFLR